MDRGTVDLDAGRGTGGDTEGDRLANIENVEGSGHADTLTGADAANRLGGGAGNDTLTGGEGDDLLAGDEGGDRISGGAGVDTLTYETSCEGGRVVLSNGEAERGCDAQGDVIEDVEIFVGSTQSDEIRGDPGADTLTGGAGNDILDGSAGDDLLAGGAGGDTIVGGLGTAPVSYAGSGERVRVVLDDGRAEAGGDADGDWLEGVEVVIGSAQGNEICGSMGAKTIDGGAPSSWC
ncbi:calcium-binding protein [Azospirillum sp. TSO35-2]|uniref:calcium-binding protein n=1 Tax=Azospirillum sp. TSO35-2 TaxID=716796 RepID=UPI000D61D8D2|nr:calcium-binding protein [Azospirillum sp. TSO35-2]PWC39516.1 hypothetical protein TSO352_05085 [Azospirillum sp. TSO35-2]